MCSVDAALVGEAAWRWGEAMAGDLGIVAYGWWCIVEHAAFCLRGESTEGRMTAREPNTVGGGDSPPYAGGLAAHC
jgi:hypothetical protein